MVNDDSLVERYRIAMQGDTVTARALKMYLIDGLSACEISARIGRTTTPETISAHLARNGIGSVRWCPVHSDYHEIGGASAAS